MALFRGSYDATLESGPTVSPTRQLLDGRQGWKWTAVSEHLCKRAQRDLSSLSEGLIG